MHRRHALGAGSTARTARLATLAVAVITVLAMLTSGAGGSHSSRSLGIAESFAVLAGSTVTNVPGSGTVINGDLGVFPGTAITGNPQVNRAIHAGDAVAGGAQSISRATYTTLAALPCTETLPGIVGNLTLVPGVYCFTSDALLTGTLTLDFQGKPDAEFVFKVGTQLTTASSTVVEVINTPNPCNVFWQIGSSAVLGTNSVFVGTIIADQSITAATGVDVTGRLLALVGQVSLDNNTVNLPTCAADATTTTAGSGATSTTTGGSGATSTTTGGSGATSTTTGGPGATSTTAAPASTTTAIAGVTIPVITIPDVTIPGVTIPGVTIPVTTIPGVTIPVITIPDVTIPGVTIPGVTIPGAGTTTTLGDSSTRPGTTSTTTANVLGATTTTAASGRATATTLRSTATTVRGSATANAAGLARTGADGVAPTTAAGLLVIMLGNWMLLASRRKPAR